jgi:hypothetical protein
MCEYDSPQAGGEALGAHSDRVLGLVLVFEQLDLVFYLELLSLYIVDQVLIGQRPVDFVL